MRAQRYCLWGGHHGYVQLRLLADLRTHNSPRKPGPRPPVILDHLAGHVHVGPLPPRAH